MQLISSRHQAFKVDSMLFSGFQFLNSVFKADSHISSTSVGIFWWQFQSIYSPFPAQKPIHISHHTLAHISPLTQPFILQKAHCARTYSYFHKLYHILNTVAPLWGAGEVGGKGTRRVYPTNNYRRSFLSAALLSSRTHVEQMCYSNKHTAKVYRIFAV